MAVKEKVIPKKLRDTRAPRKSVSGESGSDVGKMMAATASMVEWTLMTACPCHATNSVTRSSSASATLEWSRSGNSST